MGVCISKKTIKTSYKRIQIYISHTRSYETLFTLFNLSKKCHVLLPDVCTSMLCESSVSSSSSTMVWSCRIIHGVEAFRRLDMMMADPGFLWVDRCPHLASGDITEAEVPRMQDYCHRVMGG